MEKRVIIAVILSVVIIVAFQHMMPKQAAIPPQQVTMEKAAPESVVQQDAYVSAKKPSEVYVEEKKLKAETDKYILTFSNIGGAIKEIELKEHISPDSDEPLKLVDIKNPSEYIFNIKSLVGPAFPEAAVYTPENKGGAIIYTAKIGDYEITKKYILSKSKYTIELQLLIKNLSGSAKPFDYRIIGGAGVSENNMQDRRFIEVSGKIDGKTIGFKRPKDNTIVNPGIVSWSALKNKYFSIIIKPFVAAASQFYRQDSDGNLVMGLNITNITIQPNAYLDNKFLLYAGPGQMHMLKEIGYEFEDSINYGFFGGISKIMISGMRFIYNIVHSWGLSIIILSVLLNIVLFPLTMKSFKSMQKMQELHPQMEKLKAQHKDNPQKLNKEIMELYKKYNINPFSGCLPMLLQMPIFIALYQALMRSIELRGAGFLWIKDLSMPDAVNIPITLPIVGSSINILPIIMVVGMVMQQKISTKTMGSAVSEEQKQQQKMMLIVMPVVFGFIFYNMPSGLVLYWVVNTALMIVEQAAILKKE